MEKDVLCAIMTITAGVDLGSLWGILGVFPFDSLSYSKQKKKITRIQFSGHAASEKSVAATPENLAGFGYLEIKKKCRLLRNKHGMFSA